MDKSNKDKLFLKELVTAAIILFFAGGLAYAAVDCGSQSISGPDEITSNDSTGQQYTLTNTSSVVSWTATAEQGSASLDSPGLLTTSNACGIITLTVEDECCPPVTKKVRVSDSGTWWSLGSQCDCVARQLPVTICFDGEFSYSQYSTCFLRPGDPRCPSYCGGVEYGSATKFQYACTDPNP